MTTGGNPQTAVSKEILSLSVFSAVKGKISFPYCWDFRAWQEAEL
jgi:hypothetical protein